MDTQALRTAVFADDGFVPPWSRDVQLFLDVAAGMLFETRYFGERQWCATTADEAAHTLAPYHWNLSVCLERIMDGEEVASRLSLFRLARRQPRTQAAEQLGR